MSDHLSQDERDLIRARGWLLENEPLDERTVGHLIRDVREETRREPRAEVVINGTSHMWTHDECIHVVARIQAALYAVGLPGPPRVSVCSCCGVSPSSECPFGAMPF